jgi:two-component system, LytTR family, response regulator
LKGFELHVTDYLLKPYSFTRFLQAANRLDQTRATPFPGYLFVKTGSRLEKIDLTEIRYIEGMRDQRCIYLTDKKIMTPETFGELERQLPASHFCRVHKSYIVGIQHIRSIERDRLIIGQELLPVSDTYKQQFYDRIKKPR